MKCMCRVVGVRDGADVGEQLLAGADVPPILALVDRDHDGQVGRKPGDGVDRGRVDVRGNRHFASSSAIPAEHQARRTRRRLRVSDGLPRTRGPPQHPDVGLPKLGLLKRAGSLRKADPPHGLHQVRRSRRDRLRRPRPLQPGARSQGVARHRVQRLEVLGRHPVRAAGERLRRDRVQRLLEPQAAAHRQGRRLDRLAGREGART